MVANIREVNPRAVIVETDTVISASDKAMIKGKSVLVVEDGPTLTHGGMVTGAGVEAARQFEADGVVNPRPYAQGVIADTYANYPHLGPILPAVGYYPQQLRDLEATINAVPADVVVSATPFSLGSLLKLNKPLVQITYELGGARGAETVGSRALVLVEARPLPADERPAGARFHGAQPAGTCGWETKEFEERRPIWLSNCPICLTRRTLWNRISAPRRSSTITTSTTTPT